MLSERGGPIRLFVVDDHPVVREGVATLVSNDPTIVVVGYAPTGRGALDMIAAVQPDVVLLDLRLPDMQAPEIVTALKRDGAGCKMVIFTAYADHAALQAVRTAGADGCLMKDVRPLDFVDAIHRVASGETVFDDRVVPRPAERERHSASLTPREYDVLRRAAMGETNPEIAEALDLSRHTVKAYLQSMMQKLGARNRVEAIARANEMGLL